MNEAHPGTKGRRPVIAVIGAGPAGLGAAHELTRNGLRPVVFEAGPMVGGIARTEVHHGFRFDIGGHRYFTRSASIRRLWEETLGRDLLLVNRLSRIRYNGRYLDYPLRLKNTLTHLGPAESARILASYLRARAFPFRNEDTFDRWVSNRFGRRLYRLFFKTYTEKIWGMPCTRIRSDWAAQRIRGLSLATAAANALLRFRPPRSLAHDFRYPALGSGMMWERLAAAVTSAGGRLRLHAGVYRLRHADGSILSIGVSGSGPPEEVPVDQVISSMPVSRLVAAMRPPAPGPVLEAAAGLRYRSLMLVGLILNRGNMFPDQWIYVHSPGVQVGRIQNFTNWSPLLSPDPNRTHLGLEYFCDKNDAVWRLSDAQAVRMASEELESLGLAPGGDVSDGFVIRQADAYPVYDENYRRHLEIIRRYLAGFANLQTIGRNGTHRYHNMDHAMRSGILAAQNLLGARHDLWALDDDAYLE